MANEMRDKGIAIANQAVDADNAGNYKDAIEKYGKATEYLITALKSEKNPVTQKTIREKCNEYLSRMDQLKKGQEPKAAAAGSGGGKGKEERSNDVPAERGAASWGRRMTELANAAARRIGNAAADTAWSHILTSHPGLLDLFSRGDMGQIQLLREHHATFDSAIKRFGMPSEAAVATAARRLQAQQSAGTRSRGDFWTAGTCLYGGESLGSKEAADMARALCDEIKISCTVQMRRFETLVDAGYQPEVAYFECMHELKLIVDLLHEGGIWKMHKFISETAKYGDLTRGSRIVTRQTKAEMRKILKEIQQGKFARQWIRENKGGRKKYHAMLKADLDRPIEKVGFALRARMPWLDQGR
jgi:hypothetical protein